MFRFTDLIIFRMTRDCNLNCKYCFMQNKADYKGEIINLDMLKKIIIQITNQRLINRMEQKSLQLVLHGGEVLLLGVEKLRDILEFITMYFSNNLINFSLACQTNATLLTDEITKLLVKYNVNIGLSFDGIGESNSSRTSIKQEIFEKKFDMLKENKARYGFLIVASKQNVDTMQQTQEYLENLGLDDAIKSDNLVKGYKINYAEDMINPGINSEIEISGHKMFEKVWKPELNRFLNRKKSIEHHTNELLEKTLIDILSKHTNEIKSGCSTKWCGAGICMIAIEPDGEMDFCDRYSKKFEDVYIQHALDYDFLGINQLKRVLEYNIMKKGLYEKHKCDYCKADYICDHGCESFYRSKYGNYGIDTRLICDQHIEFYEYIENNLYDFLMVFLENNIPIKTKDYIEKLVYPEFDTIQMELIDHTKIFIRRK